MSSANSSSNIVRGSSAIMLPRRLLKTQFEEIETDGCAERIKKRVERSPVIGEKDLPGFQVRNRTFDGSADGTDLIIVFVFAHVKFTTLWLLGRRNVTGSLKCVHSRGSGVLRDAPALAGV